MCEMLEVEKFQPFSLLKSEFSTGVFHRTCGKLFGTVRTARYRRRLSVFTTISFDKGNPPATAGGSDLLIRLNSADISIMQNLAREENLF